VFQFTILQLEVSTTKEDIISAVAGKKFLSYASKLAFLSQFDVTEIEKLDAERLTLETKQKIEMTVHPSGTFHFATMYTPMSQLSLLERWVSKIATIYKRFARKNLQFDINFHSHTDIESKSQLTEMSRIFNALRINSPLKHTAGVVTPQYVIARLSPIPTAKAMFIGYHRGFVDMYFTLKPLTPQKMKDKYLIKPVDTLISVLFKEIGN